jgi:hypothetical protein
MADLAKRFGGSPAVEVLGTMTPIRNGVGFDAAYEGTDGREVEQLGDLREIVSTWYG